MNEEQEKKFKKIMVVIKWNLRKLKHFLKAFLGKCFRGLTGRARFLVILIVILAAGSLTGYGIGRHMALASAERKEKKLTAEYTKKTESLEAKLKEAQIKDPKERPWNLVLVNDTHPMTEGYVPKLADVGNGHQVDERIADALNHMLADAKKAGLNPMICSAYRTIEYQQKLYNEYMGNAVKEGLHYWDALKKTKDSPAYPGRSEHNIGLAVDIVSSSYTQLDTKQEETPEAKWLAENCYKYGFILRYPNGKTDITGIIYEPWHYRYVGVEDAKKITETGVTLEEYLGED